MTDDGDWLPFGVEDDDVQIANFLALHEDVPPWLDVSLWQWIGRNLLQPLGGYGEFRTGLLLKAERVLQEPMPVIESHQYETGMPRLREAYVSKSDQAVLKLVDFLVAELSVGHHPLVAMLDETLSEARSAWRVGERRGRKGLVRRLPKGVEDAVKAATELPNGGKRLAEAWNAAFGLEPDPSRAYSLAIVAVEDAAIPVVCPKKTDAVLGDAIGELNANEKWSLPHQREHAEAPPRQVLVAMMRMLNRGQHDRHGGAPLPLPDMTQPEAESAVMLAATLVGWFETGKVTKSP